MIILLSAKVLNLLLVRMLVYGYQFGIEINSSCFEIKTEYCDALHIANYGLTVLAFVLYSILKYGAVVIVKCSDYCGF
jgi:hypothetical protein